MDESTPPDRPTTDPAPGRRRWPLLALAVAVSAGLLGGLVVGRATATEPDRLRDDVSVGFAQDMATHHAQAVAMSAVAHRRSPEPLLSYLAFDVLTTQQGQIGIMSAWLRDSEQPQTSDEPMSWMEPAHSGPMPGTASAADVAALDVLPVARMEEQFLRLMVRHHAGALPMAAYAVEHADSEKVRELARRMEQGQTAEIDALNDLLADRGLAPEPVETGGHGDGHGG